MRLLMPLATCVMAKFLQLFLFICAVFHAGLPAFAHEPGGDSLSSKRVLYINAYSPGYAWSDAEQREIEKKLDSESVEHKVLYMHSKVKNREEEILSAALGVRGAIEEYKPDLVIMSDDNTVKHVLAPWYKNSDLPIVFCGVNWECGQYGLPTKNVTGMLEVSLIPQMLETVQLIARGPRIAMLANENETDRKEGEMIPKRFGVKWAAERYIRTFEEWKTEYRRLQNEVDIIFLYGTAGVMNWDEAAARSFILENTKVITCSSQYYMKDMVLVGYMKSGEEQGYWAAQTAVKILGGVSPQDIPITENKTARITLNMRLARRLGVVFPIKLLKQAELIVRPGTNPLAPEKITLGIRILEEDATTSIPWRQTFKQIDASTFYLMRDCGK